jgi:hypothetical protein
MKLRHKPLNDKECFLLLDIIFTIMCAFDGQEKTKFLADTIKKNWLDSLLSVYVASL